MARLLFHWDFFGPDALPTAEHFLRHLDHFCIREGVNGHRNWTTDERIRAVATMECDERYLGVIRDALRPKRAERVLE